MGDATGGFDGLWLMMSSLILDRGRQHEVTHSCTSGGPNDDMSLSS